MAYRNKTFVSFASEDLHYYRLMCAWRANERIEFDFLDAHDINTARDTSSPDTIRRRLSERLANTKQVVMLIGDATRAKAARSTSFLNHEVSVIQSLAIPVIFANLNKVRQAELSRIPAALISRYTMSVAFGPKPIRFALDDFPDVYHSNQSAPSELRKNNPHYYWDSVYSENGL
jgi:hypothetical protein